MVIGQHCITTQTDEPPPFPSRHADDLEAALWWKSLHSSPPSTAITEDVALWACLPSFSPVCLCGSNKLFRQYRPPQIPSPFLTPPTPLQRPPPDVLIRSLSFLLHQQPPIPSPPPPPLPSAHLPNAARRPRWADWNSNIILTSV